MSWRDRPLAGFDIESSGLDVETVSIVTACVGIVWPGSAWGRVNWLLKQDQPIPAEATAVHGITTEQANTDGMDHATGVREIRDALYTYWAKDAIVVAYNAPYDLTLLDRELRRIGEPGLDIRGPVIDPLVCDKALDTYRKGSRKLIDTCAHYGIPLDADDAHGAEPDALAATRLAWKLAPQLPVDDGELMAWQAQAYAKQRASFAQYLRRQRKHAEADQVELTSGWPLVQPTLTVPGRKAA